MLFITNIMYLKCSMKGLDIFTAGPKKSLIGQPESSQVLHEFVQIPQDIMRYGHYDDRMRYGSSQFTFPVPGYHPDPPTPPMTSAYEQPTGGGYGQLTVGGYEQPTGGYDLSTPGGGQFNDSFMNIFETPSMSQNMLDQPTGGYQQYTPYYNIDQRNQQTGEHRSAFRVVTPIQMGNFSDVGTSQNPSSSSNDDVDEQNADQADDVEEELGRGHRNRNEPLCGTGGHRGWRGWFRGRR